MHNHYYSYISEGVREDLSGECSENWIHILFLFHQPPGSPKGDSEEELSSESRIGIGGEQTLYPLCTMGKG